MNKKKLPSAIIIDIDDCFLKKEHYIPRPKTDSREGWDNFQNNYSKMFKANLNIVDLLFELYDKYIFLFITSREATNFTKRQTETNINNIISYQLRKIGIHHTITINKSLSNNNIEYMICYIDSLIDIFNYKIIFREYDDYRNTVQVKSDLYEKYVMNNYNVKYAFDDLDSVCEMWNKKYNITSFVVKNNNIGELLV